MNLETYNATLISYLVFIVLYLVRITASNLSWEEERIVSTLLPPPNYIFMTPTFPHMYNKYLYTKNITLHPHLNIYPTYPPT